MFDSQYFNNVQLTNDNKDLTISLVRVSKIGEGDPISGITIEFLGFFVGNQRSKVSETVVEMDNVPDYH